MLPLSFHSRYESGQAQETQEEHFIFTKSDAYNTIIITSYHFRRHTQCTAWQWEELMRCLKVLLQQESIIFGLPGSAWHQSQEGVQVYIHMMNTAPSCGKIVWIIFISQVYIWDPDADEALIHYAFSPCYPQRVMFPLCLSVSRSLDSSPSTPCSSATWTRSWTSCVSRPSDSSPENQGYNDVCCNVSDMITLDSL